MKNNNKIFVVINLGWLGDTLLTSVLTQDIKLNYPDSKVVFIASKPFKEIAEGMAGVDEVFVYDKNGEHSGIFGGVKFAKNFPYWGKIYCTFSVHSHERSILLALAIGSRRIISAPLRHSFLNLFITNKFKYSERMIRNTYKAEFNASYLSILTKKPPQSTMKFSYPKKYDGKALQILEQYGYKGEKLIGLCPLAKDDWRSLKVDDVAKFIELAEQNQIKVVLVGAGKSGEFAEQIKGKTNIPFIDLTNKTTIFELSAIINTCRVFLSVDTGPMHISYSLGHKTVCLFFDKSMIEEWGPKTFSNAVILCNEDEKITPELCLKTCLELI